MSYCARFLFMLSVVICFVGILRIKVSVTMFLTLKPGFPRKTDEIWELGPSPGM